MDFLEAIRRDSDRFYAVADGADPAAPVPSCPDWSVADLVWHLGEVHWFWATDVEERASDPGEIEKLKPPRPEGYEELVAWGRSQAGRLIDVLDATSDDVRVWTWSYDESGNNVGFVRRHQVQETAVHRWDVQTAASGAPDPIDTDVALDAIDEFLSVTLPWCIRADKAIAGSVHIHCTDGEGEWFVHADGRVERAHAKADAAVRGPASDVLLALFKRVPLDALDVVGDEAVARQFVEAMNTE